MQEAPAEIRVKVLPRGVSIFFFRVRIKSTFTGSLIHRPILQCRRYYSHFRAADIDPVSSPAISVLSAHQAVTRNIAEMHGRVMYVSGSPEAVKLRMTGFHSSSPRAKSSHFLL